MGLVRIQFRRDTTANWQQYNPILLDGEAGYEVTADNLLHMKVGDGYYDASGVLQGTHWNDLPYIGGAMGPMPQHQWDGTSIRFQQTAETWGQYVDLKGPQGDQGLPGDVGNPGPKGDDGAPGAPGAAAGFGTPTASVDAGTGTPSVSVTASGPDTAKVFNFSFSNLKGATGSPGTNGSAGAAAGFGTPTVSVSNTSGTPSCTISTSGPNTAKIFNFSFSGLKGEDGYSGDSVALLPPVLYTLRATNGYMLNTYFKAVAGLGDIGAAARRIYAANANAFTFSFKGDVYHSTNPNLVGRIYYSGSYSYWGLQFKSSNRLISMSARMGITLKHEGGTGFMLHCGTSVTSGYQWLLGGSVSPHDFVPNEAPEQQATDLTCHGLAWSVSGQNFWPLIVSTSFNTTSSIANFSETTVALSVFPWMDFSVLFLPAISVTSNYSLATANFIDDTADTLAAYSDTLGLDKNERERQIEEARVLGTLQAQIKTTNNDEFDKIFNEEVKQVAATDKVRVTTSNNETIDKGAVNEA